MKVFIGILGGLLTFAFSSPLSFAESAFIAEKMHRPAPAHPTVIFGEYEKHTLPIVDVRGENPEVEYKEKLQRLAPSAPYHPERGDFFVPGFVRFTDQRAGWSKTNLVYHLNSGGEVSGGTLRENSDYEATLIPSVSYKNCYLAVMFYQPGPEGDKSTTIVMFHSVGDLTANQPRKISIRFAYLGEQMGKMSFFPLIFQGGREIRSNLSDVAAHFFRRGELLRHEKILEVYRSKNAGKDAQLQAYLRIPPILPDNIDRSKIPNKVEASFMVDTDGTVDSIEFENRLDSAVRNAVRASLDGWLFLPKLKEGAPVRTMVKVPLVLGGTADAPK